MDKYINFFYNNTCFAIFLFYPVSFSLIFKNKLSIYKCLIECGGMIVFPSLVQDETIGFFHPA